MVRSLRSIGRVLRRAFLVLLAAGLVAVAGLALIGVPTPPGMEADGVSRVPWKWLWRSAGVARAIQGSSWIAAWHPERPEILVYSGQRIHRIREPGAAPEVVEELPPFAAWPQFSPQGARLVYALDEGGSELYRYHLLDLSSGTSAPLSAAPAGTEGFVFRGDGKQIAFGSTARNGSDHDVYLQDVDPAGAPRMVYEASGSFLPEAWSPSGSSLVVVETVSHAAARPWLFDLAAGEMRALLEEWGATDSFSDPQWSPDGQTLYFLSNRGTDVAQVRRLHLATGQVETISPELGWDVSDLALAPDGRRLVFLLNEEGIPSLYQLDLESLEAHPAPGQPAGVLRNLEMHSRLDLVGFDVVAPSGQHYAGAYQLDEDRFESWSLAGKADAMLLPVEVVHYPTFDQVDGAPRRISAFLLPAATTFEGPRPVLIDIHGGPAQQASPTPFIHHQAIRRVGVSVVRPNVRGSAGYGKAFLALDDGRLREDAVRDIGALLDWVASRPDLDSERVALMGWSYGGYLTLASLVRYSDRVRCAIDMFGISDLVAHLEASREEHFVEAQRAEYGDERDPEMRDFLRSISPSSRATEITAPLLVYQGLNDVRVKAQQSRRIVEQVRRNGVEVWYLEAAHEGHNLERPLNRMYFGCAGLSFLDRHLSPSQ